ncbi:IS3 family transposase [Streptomyces sp. NPDC005813]|uniref:IS3 family transposase n=1 Tax=Streptomyces sp. NPDC005813 TaxID=3155592 RepID=UPI003410CD14
MTGAAGTVFEGAREAALEELAGVVGRVRACVALGVNRATWYRHHRQSPPPPRSVRERRPHPKALTPAEREAVVAKLNGERFRDTAPAEVYATLLDEGVYLCSESTMYRILRERGEVRERRRQATHPPRKKPELMADAPNRVWSWDVTRLKGPDKRVFYCLYTMIDIYSRYTVGWMVTTHESEELAKQFIEDSVAKHGIDDGELTIHSDRGAIQTAKSVAVLMADLGVTRSHSRPKISNDNPYSEAQYKTIKYRPDYPDRFGSLSHARHWCAEFFHWYHYEHRHSGIGYHTPYDVHHGEAVLVRELRAKVLADAYNQYPERFVRKFPEPPSIPDQAWINRPTHDATFPAERSQEIR